MMNQGHVDDYRHILNLRSIVKVHAKGQIYRLLKFTRYDM